MADERSPEYNLEKLCEITDISMQGDSKDVIIYIYDHGTSNPHVQYSCKIVQLEDSKTITGNGEPNIIEAIAAVGFHCNELD